MAVLEEKGVILGRGMGYIFLDDDAYLLDCAVELIEVDLALVVDVEKLKALGQEALLALRRGTLLHYLGSHFALKTRKEAKLDHVEKWICITL